MLTTATVAAAAALAAAAAVAVASSHSEAPSTNADSAGDLTDVYAFRSYEAGREDYVVLLANINGLQDRFAGPFYHPIRGGIVLDVNVDNDCDYRSDLTFTFVPGARLGGARSRARGGKHEGLRVPVGPVNQLVPLANVAPIDASGAEIDESGLNLIEYYRLRVARNRRDARAVRLDDGPWARAAADGATTLRKPFDFAGRKTFVGGNVDAYEQYAQRFVHSVRLPRCAARAARSAPRDARVFVGQRRDAFAVALGRVFDLLNFADPTVADGGAAENVLGDKMVTTFALEVHRECLAGGGAAQPGARSLGVWAAVRRLEHRNGGEHWATEPKSRLANPLFNELFVGVADKDAYNRGTPPHDARFATYAQYPVLPVLLESQFGASFGYAAPTNLPRRDLVAALLTGLEGVNQEVDAVCVPQRCRSRKVADDDDDDGKHYGDDDDSSSDDDDDDSSDDDDGSDIDDDHHKHSRVYDDDDDDDDDSRKRSVEQLVKRAVADDDDDDDDAVLDDDGVAADAAPGDDDDDGTHDDDDDDDSPTYEALQCERIVADVIRLRVDTEEAPTARADQSRLGLLGAKPDGTPDLDGYPNGRRPGDDAVDITLRLASGALCHTDVARTLALCDAADAPAGQVPLGDGAFVDATELPPAFPFLNTPRPGDAVQGDDDLNV